MLLAALEPEIDVAYSKIATISSTDSVLGCLEWKQSLGVHWPFLSDAHKVVQRELDIAEYTDPHHEPFVPYTLMLEPGLVVYRVYNGYWYWGRPTPEEVRQDFRAITRRVRPDWDLADPEVRRRWEAGEKHTFYPYRER